MPRQAFSWYSGLLLSGGVAALVFASAFLITYFSCKTDSNDDKKLIRDSAVVGAIAAFMVIESKNETTGDPTTIQKTSLDKREIEELTSSQ